jgi:hypothetical protein
VVTTPGVHARLGGDEIEVLASRSVVKISKGSAPTKPIPNWYMMVTAIAWEEEIASRLLSS